MTDILTGMKDRAAFLRPLAEELRLLDAAIAAFDIVAKRQRSSRPVVPVAADPAPENKPVAPVVAEPEPLAQVVEEPIVETPTPKAPEPLRRVKQRSPSDSLIQFDERVLKAIKRGVVTRRGLMEKLDATQKPMQDSLERLLAAGTIVATGKTRARQFHAAGEIQRAYVPLEATGLTVTDVGKALKVDNARAIEVCNKLVDRGVYRRDDDGRLHKVARS